MEEFDLTYLSVDSVQEGVGSSQIYPLVLRLAQADLKVCLVSFEKKILTPQISQTFNSAGVTWIPKNFGDFGAVGGLNRLNNLRKSIPTSRILHGRSDIPTAAAILNSHNSPVLWDVRSLWSDQRLSISTPGWNIFTARAAKELENLCARKAHAMSTLTNAVVPILENRHKKIPSLREVIPTCVRTDLFQPTELPKGQVICLISGTYNNYYNLERTREIISYLRKFINLKVIWARPHESPSLRLEVGEDEIVEVGHSYMPELIKLSHFGIAICREDDSKSLSAAIPTKIAEFLSSGRPVILSKGIGDLDRLITETRTGLIVGENDSLNNISDDLMSLILDLETPDRCRSLALNHFSFDMAFKKYLNLYKKMIS